MMLVAMVNLVKRWLIVANTVNDMTIGHWFSGVDA